jgi:hypothetical protein
MRVGLVIESVGAAVGFVLCVLVVALLATALFAPDLLIAGMF